MTCIAFNPVRARVFVHGISKVCARQCDHQRPVTEALENMVDNVVVQHTKSCAAARRQWVSSSGGACICALHAHHLSRFSIFLTFISSSELSGVFRTKTSAPSAPRRPPGAPLTARCCRQAGCMMTRGGQALEPSTPASWLAHTVRRRSMQAYEATAVMPSMMAMDEFTTRWQGTARARQGLPRKPEGAGIEINSVTSLYNTSFGDADWHDTLVVPQPRVLPEDVLR